MGQSMWPPRKKKSVDSCSPGSPGCDTPPSTGKKHKTKQPVPEPQTGTHMNVRDTEMMPGQVRMQKKSSSDALTETQMQRGSAAENAIAKVKMVFKKKKR